MLASRGSRGQLGDKGDQGEKGERGDKGERGASPVALVVLEDEDALILTMEDGTELRCDLYPLLRKVAR